MNRVIAVVICVWTVAVISGCVASPTGSASTNENGATTSVTCAYGIKYSGYQVEVNTVVVPVGGKTINVGKVFVAPQKIQEAQAVTQALDVLQFNQCQTMMLLPANQRREYVQRREQTLAALTQALKAIDNSKNAAEYNKAVRDAESQKTKIIQGTGAAGQNTSEAN